MAASDRTLRLIEINKEVILLRQAVRKAKICLVSKLTREAKKLRSKRGDEKQLEKNTRKAEKLGREVTALKTVKDDEISRYGIFNLEKLQEVSQDPTVSDLIRVTAKVANQKSFLPKLQKFREKFPDYEEHVPTKKKKAKGKEKKPAKEVDGKVTRPNETKRVTTIQSDEENNETNNNNDDPNEIDKDDEEENNSNANSDSLDSDTVNKNKRASSPLATKSSAKESKVSKKDIVTKKVPSPEGETDNDNEPISLPTAIESNTKKSKVNQKNVTEKVPSEEPMSKEQSPKPVKVISKVATVKRFTEVLQEDNESSAASDSKEIYVENENIEIEKEVDDFFMSADNNGAHFVVAAVPTVEDTETEWDNHANDRYFNKNTQRRHKEKSFNNDIKWDSGPKRKGKWNDSDRMSQMPHRSSQHQEFRKGHAEPEKKKSRRNEEGTNVNVPEHLHPSWEAKRKQQEILKLGFQGKKIVFGDD